MQGFSREVHCFLLGIGGSRNVDGQFLLRTAQTARRKDVIP